MAYPYQRIFERDNFTCRYCGWRGDQDFARWFVGAFCIDHVRPVIDGGGEEDSNLVLSCFACNHYKGSFRAQAFDDAKKYVMERRCVAEAWFRQHVLKSN
jgi:5-methylcytosine-specific restriction endonuclease McrA